MLRNRLNKIENRLKQMKNMRKYDIRHINLSEHFCVCFPKRERKLLMTNRCSQHTSEITRI